MGCALPRSSLESIQAGTIAYTYRGVPTYKNPFDLALYQMLLWRLRPRTVFEVGSRDGGSALWFADVLKSFEVDAVIHSVDIHSARSVGRADVVFHQGDGRALGPVFPPPMMAALPRPFLVVEDADHSRDTTLAVLNFFDPWMQPGEYLIVEDGIVDDLFDETLVATLDGGPRRGIADFLDVRGDDYDIDVGLCDHFGQNVTWNTNGYLRRRP
jgi:cephalosporin hydroxylase